ncbi:hypothetical protein T492DRAFT_1047907 [Pavlovales sp. CCMP2436]|nr:hypothetical protein T492DRAFT_1047907 [Pavlovales sp. CCMP2436]
MFSYTHSSAMGTEWWHRDGNRPFNAITLCSCLCLAVAPDLAESIFELVYCHEL